MVKEENCPHKNSSWCNVEDKPYQVVLYLRAHGLHSLSSCFTEQAEVTSLKTDIQSKIITSLNYKLLHLF